MQAELKENTNGIRYPRIESNTTPYLSSLSHERADDEVDLVDLIGKSVDIYQKRKKEIIGILIRSFMIIFTIVLLLYCKNIFNTVKSKVIYVSNMTGTSTLIPSNQIEKIIYNLKNHIKNRDFQSLSNVLNINMVEATKIRDIQISDNDEHIYEKKIGPKMKKPRPKNEKSSSFFYIKLKTKNTDYLKIYEKAIMFYINNENYIKNELSIINKNIAIRQKIIDVLKLEIIALEVKEKKYAHSANNNRGQYSVFTEILREKNGKQEVLVKEQEALNVLKKRKYGAPKILSGFDSAQKERLNKKPLIKLLFNIVFLTAIFTLTFTIGKIIIRESLEVYASRK